MILLDTDILSLFHKGHARITARMSQIDATETVGTTIITQAEILRARYEFLLKATDGDQLQRAQAGLERSQSLLDDLLTIPVDEKSAVEFDRLRQDKKLRKIGRADLLIACIALAHRATLVTKNIRHFRQVPGLRVENWADE